MPHPFTRRRVTTLLLGALAVVVVVLFGRWREASKNGGQRPAEPFRIAGNLYYVGASDIASYLITGPQGHILIDGGYPGTPPLIMASIEKLGFDIRDVKILLNSEPHYDHAGGLAELQKASGAELWASERSADVIAAGGGEEASTFPIVKVLYWLGLTRYPAARVDHRFSDGDTIHLGSTALTAHLTPGHTRGCTTWSFPVRDGDRTLNVVYRCSLTLLPGMRFVEPQRYPGIRADLEHSFRTLRRLPVDIWITAHAREFGRYRKFSERGRRGADSVAPFIDREGYMRSIDSAEARFKRLLAEQQRGD